MSDDNTLREREDRGYLIIANSAEEQTLAATCANSIKIKNPNASVSVILPYSDSILEHLTDSFDYAIQLPFGFSTDHRRIDDWQLYWATPYMNNIVIDCNTIVMDDHTALWDYLTDNFDVAFSDKIKTFKGEVRDLGVVPDTNVKIVDPNIFFFKYDRDNTRDYFKMCDVFFQNWQDTIDSTIGKKYRKSYFEPALMHSLVLDRIWNNQDFITDRIALVDMENAKQEYHNKCVTSWNEYLNMWVTPDAKVKIQNFSITDTFNYANSSVITQDIYDRIRDYYRTISR